MARVPWIERRFGHARPVKVQEAMGSPHADGSVAAPG